MRVISWSPERLSASQEGFCAVELDSCEGTLLWFPRKREPCQLSEYYHESNYYSWSWHREDRVHSVVTKCGGWQWGYKRRTFIPLPPFPLCTFAFVVRLFVTVREFASCWIHLLVTVTWLLLRSLALLLCKSCSGGVFTTKFHPSKQLVPVPQTYFATRLEAICVALKQSAGCSGSSSGVTNKGSKSPISWNCIPFQMQFNFQNR
jgi:hypothetical protein